MVCAGTFWRIWAGLACLIGIGLSGNVALAQRVHGPSLGAMSSGRGGWQGSGNGFRVPNNTNNAPNIFQNGGHSKGTWGEGNGTHTTFRPVFPGYDGNQGYGPALQPTDGNYPAQPQYLTDAPASNQTTQPDPTPAANVLPTLAEEVAEVPLENPGFALKTDSFSRDDQTSLLQQLASNTSAQAQTAIDAVKTLAGATLSVAKPPISAANQSTILDAVASGNSQQVADALKTAGISPSSSTAAVLLKQTAAVQAVNTVAADIKAGTATLAELKTVHDKLVAAGVGNAQANNTAVALFVDCVALKITKTAQLGQNNLPQGSDVPILLAGSLPEGTVLPLGNSAVIIGTGGATAGLQIGTGDVAEVAGIPVPIGPPAPGPQGEAVTSGVVLINGVKVPVNYNVNQTPFTMAPGYTQTLPGGQAWVVAFDRGGNNGQGRYSLSDGTYSFTATAKGWELYQQSYTVTLDNSLNKSPFNYVLQGKRQVLPASQAQELTSAYIPILRFDDGKHEVKEKELKSGIFKVCATQDQTIDLFPAEALKVPEPVIKSRFKLDQKALPKGFRPIDPVALFDRTDSQMAAGDILPKSLERFVSTVNAVNTDAGSTPILPADSGPPAPAGT